MSPDAEKLTVAEARVHVDDDPLAPATPFRRRLYATVAHFLLSASRLWFGIRIEGIEHIPTDRPFILAPVHRSNLDFALVVGCTGPHRRMRFLAKDTLWKGLWGRLWTALGAVPVHRGAPDREALTTCVGVLDRGEPLVMFPEGTRQTGPVVQDLFDGVAYVQGRTGVPIVPVGIGGSETAMPKGAKFVRRQQVVLVVGSPLVAPPRTEQGRVSRSAVRDRTTELHQVLQVLFDDAQRKAGTPNA